MAGPTATPTRTPTSDLQTILDAVIQSKPSEEDFVDPADSYYDAAAYNDAFSSWIDDYMTVRGAISALEKSELGLMEMPDGTMVPTGPMTPEQTAALNAANANVYNEVMNRFGLQSYNLATQRTDRENTRRQADFENKATAFDRGLAVDDQNLDSATAELSKWIAGQDAAQGAAGLKQNAQRSAIDYGTTGGKTSFSASDLGGGIGALARQAGVQDMNAPLLQFPGYQTMDPIGDIEAARTAYGTGGPAPMIPVPGTTREMIPQVPELLPDNTPLPAMAGMTAPPMLAVPGASNGAAQLRAPGQSFDVGPSYIDPATLSDPNAAADAAYLNLFPRFNRGTGGGAPALLPDEPDVAAMSRAAGLPAWEPRGGWRN